MATQPNPVKRLIPFAIILVLIGALAYANKVLNTSLKHSSVRTNGEGEEQPDPEAEKEKADAAAKAASKTVTANKITGNLLPEITVNDPATAKMKIVVGWQYDATTLMHPENLIQIIQAVKQVADSSKGAISAQIVDVDVPIEERSPTTQSINDLGVSINGQTTVTVNGKPLDLSDNPGQGVVTLANVLAALTTPAPPK